MKKILVTGGAGYIGSFMIRHLRDSGYEPIVADNLSSGHLQAVEGFNFNQIDLLYEKDKLDVIFEKEEIAGVIHMASYIQMGESFKNPAKYFENNLIVAINVLNAMQRFNVDNFILSSSAGVYGNPESLPIKEDDPKDPENPYGQTKLMIEKMLPWYEKAYRMKYISIRYFNAAGASLDGSIGEDHPEESHLIPLALKAAIGDEEFTIFGNDYNTPDGTCVRDYIHILDLVENHTMALSYLFEGGKSNYFNAGVGRGYSNNEVVTAIEKVTGKKMNIKYGQRRKGDADSLYASNEKIKKVLGWEPKYDLKKIIETAYLWHT
ncbi:MAG: UDP-glucose 4-epimerase GalE, partial [Patescibacteria group bacterium]